jgi:phospholipid/cholesterol/gamma-HCH transport system substrate-binding protein
MFTATPSQKAKVGLFLLVGGGLLAAVVVIFAGLGLSEATDEYTVRTGESVSGLRVGAPVEVHGVAVGQVTDLALGRGAQPVTLELEVEAGTTIPADARAVMRMKGVTGLQYINIDGGDFQGPLRKPGDVIPSKPSALSAITDGGTQLVAESRKLIQSGTNVTDRVGAMLDEEAERKMDLILSRGERAMASLEAAAAQMARTGARIEQLVATEGQRVLGSTDALIADTRRLVQANRTQITATMTDLREAARSFRRMAQNLEQDPSRLLFRRRAGERENP